MNEYELIDEAAVTDDSGNPIGEPLPTEPQDVPEELAKAHEDDQPAPDDYGAENLDDDDDIVEDSGEDVEPEPEQEGEADG
jgi:hypothetical protein